MHRCSPSLETERRRHISAILSGSLAIISLSWIRAWEMTPSEWLKNWTLQVSVHANWSQWQIIFYSHQSQNRLSDLVAEHLDHLHYLNDILCLNIKDLNKVLSEHLLQKLLVPLYVYSLMDPKTSPNPVRSFLYFYFHLRFTYNSDLWLLNILKC